MDPVYIFKGRTYKTVGGLSRALFNDCHCSSHSMVDKNRIITCYAGRDNIVARYQVSKAIFGEPMKIERVAE